MSNNSRTKKEERPSMWLFKTDQGYFESVVASAAVDNGKVQQYIKSNSGVSKNYKKGDYVIIWYNGLQQVSAFYTIDEIRTSEAETWNSKIIGFEGGYHRLQLIDFDSAVDDVVLVFNLIGTLQKRQAEVTRLDKGHTKQLTESDVNTQDSVGMTVKIVYKIYNNCVLGHNLKFFNRPFFLNGYSSQVYRAYKQIENKQHLHEIKSAMEESCTYRDIQTYQQREEARHEGERNNEGEGNEGEKRRGGSKGNHEGESAKKGKERDSKSPEIKGNGAKPASNSGGKKKQKSAEVIAIDERESSERGTVNRQVKDRREEEEEEEQEEAEKVFNLSASNDELDHSGVITAEHFDEATQKKATTNNNEQNEETNNQTEETNNQTEETNNQTEETNNQKETESQTQSTNTLNSEAGELSIEIGNEENNTETQTTNFPILNVPDDDIELLSVTAPPKKKKVGRPPKSGVSSRKRKPSVAGVKKAAANPKTAISAKNPNDNLIHLLDDDETTPTKPESPVYISESHVSISELPEPKTTSNSTSQSESTPPPKPNSTTNIPNPAIAKSKKSAPRSKKGAKRDASLPKSGNEPSKPSEKIDSPLLERSGSPEFLANGSPQKPVSSSLRSPSISSPSISSPNSNATSSDHKRKAVETPEEEGSSNGAPGGENGNLPDSKRTRKSNSFSNGGVLSLQEGQFAAVRGENRSIWIAKIRKDITIDKSKGKWKNTEVPVTWLIETREYDGRYMLIEDAVEWQAEVPVGSFVKNEVEVVKDKGGLWAVVGGVKPLKKLL